MPTLDQATTVDLDKLGPEQKDKFWRAILTPPQNERQLQIWVWKVLGLWLSDVAVCPNHTAPLTAFADAYFANSPRAVWKASRGLGGKTIMLSALSLTEAITLRAGVTLLGGTGEQSARVHKYMDGQDLPGKFWSAPLAPKHLLEKDISRETRLKHGGWIYALMASTASVRGPHPQRLRGDEIDEMDRKVWDAAAGQPMTRHGVRDHILGSSTHHYPDGTMTGEIKMALERGWPVHEWCYRENLRSAENPNGWLTPEQVERKKASVPALMWETEYEMQEPVVEGRAIQTSAVEWMFDRTFGEFPGELGAKLIIEEPQPGAKYCAGADWGKKRDKTIIVIYRYDLWPARLVAFYHMARMPYPVMIKAYDEIVKRYKAAAAFDATGLGTVVEDYVESEGALGVSLQGLRRANIFSDYIVAIEGHEIKAPRIAYAYNEFKFSTAEDLYRTGGHPPDSFVAGALAWWAKDNAGSSIFF